MSEHLNLFDRRGLRERVLRGMRREKYQEDGEEAYNRAARLFTKAQLGYLHGEMRRLADEQYYRDAEPM